MYIFQSWKRRNWPIGAPAFRGFRRTEDGSHRLVYKACLMMAVPTLGIALDSSLLPLFGSWFFQWSLWILHQIIYWCVHFSAPPLWEFQPKPQVPSSMKLPQSNLPPHLGYHMWFGLWDPSYRVWSTSFLWRFPSGWWKGKKIIIFRHWDRESKY